MYPSNSVRLYPVEENYLNSTFIDYYTPKYLQGGVDFAKTQGKKDAIQSLYSDEGTTPFDGGQDKFHIFSRNLTEKHKEYNDFDETDQIKIILPEGIKHVLSVRGGDTLRLKISARHQQSLYRGLVRALPTKVPGYTFMSYRQVQYFLSGLISFDQAIELVKQNSPLHLNPALHNEINQYEKCKLEK